MTNTERRRLNDLMNKGYSFQTAKAHLALNGDSKHIAQERWYVEKNKNRATYNYK